MIRARALLLWACAALALFSALLTPAGASLQTSPAWYNASAGAASTWHYRVPLTLASASGAGATAVFNVDFNALLAQLGVSGAFDVNSPRVVDAAGTLVPTQEFNDSVYQGVADAVNNGKGEVRFITPATATTYYLYFDILGNGGKAANGSTGINGGFENSVAGALSPPGWTGAKTVASLDANVRPNETISVGTDTTGTAIAARSVDASPHSGSFSYLLGARTSNETTSGTALTSLSRTIVVPSSNPGVLSFWYRVQGWDSNDDGVTGTFDYLRVNIQNGAALSEVVGPQANNYTTYPFSPNNGTVAVSTTRSGYGQYNGFDMDSTGAHHAGMSVTRGSEQWWHVTYSLAAFAGATVTLTFATSHTKLYRSWWHIDDVEWSVVNGTVGVPQGFGAAIQLPVGVSTSYYPNQPLVIRGRLDAVGKTGAVVADLYKPNGTLAVAGILLFNDGTHGDATSGDALWTNNGTVVATPTYTFAQADPAGIWTVVLRGADSSAAAGGQQAGLVKVASQPITPVNAANFSNVDTQTLTFTPFMSISGKVYTDSNRNGVLDAGEPVATAMFVKLIQGGVVLQVATPDATGSYSFGSLQSGTYTVLQSTNNTTTDLTPSVPAGNAQSEPFGASHIVDLAGGISVTRNFGQYLSDTRVSGRVFGDGGAGGATALDGVMAGTEAPLAGIVISLKDSGGTLLSQTQTRGDGQFDLSIPTTAVGTPVTLTAQAVTGFDLARIGAGTTAGSVALAAGSVTFTPVSKTAYTGVAFSELPASTLTASQAQAVNPGGVAVYAHRFTAGANGTLSLSLSSLPPAALPTWAAILYRDATCSGALTGTETPFTGTLVVTAGSMVCLIVRDIVPQNAGLNNRNLHQLTASLAVTQGATYGQAALLNQDVTTVGASQGAGLSLVKTVRNVSTSGAFGTSSQALPGESLQYRVTFRNDTAYPISGVQVFDSVPAYTLFVSASCDPMPAGLTCAVTKAPAAGATSGDIQWNFTGAVSPGGQGSVSFSWTVMN
ncbi:MAG: hypothetical protein JWQ33_2349 [Ramlibacter sp.]|nr:hypothetical protein [Ramlibacter sp.]